MCFINKYNHADQVLYYKKANIIFQLLVGSVGTVL